jgi:vesicle-associated membrane protein 7
MCDDKLTQDSAFAYLEDIKSSFIKAFTPKEIDSAYAYSLNEKFKENIKGKMNYYNANLNESDTVSKLKKGVLDYKDNILQANDILLERGEKINLIVRKADNLRTESMNYYSSVGFYCYLSIL